MDPDTKPAKRKQTTLMESWRSLSKCQKIPDLPCAEFIMVDHDHQQQALMHNNTAENVVLIPVITGERQEDEPISYVTAERIQPEVICSGGITDDFYDTESESQVDFVESAANKYSRLNIEDCFEKFQPEGATRFRIRCRDCLAHPHIVSMHKTTRLPAIATDQGTVPRREVIEQHLSSKIHHAAVQAQKFKELNSSEKTLATPILRSFLTANEALAKSIGQKMIEVYSNAKRGAPAWSWPAQHVAHQIAISFNPNDCHVDYRPQVGSLTYVNPNYHQILLHYIVLPDHPILKERILNSKAVSIRVDGSVDKFQTDNKHVMVKIVDSLGKEDTIFLGFDEPRERGTIGYVNAIKSAVERILPWNQLLHCLSSIATDGESLNTGDRNSLWKTLDDERKIFSLPPLVKVWCAVHRSNLCWKDVTKGVTELQALIADAKTLAKFYHVSGANTHELKDISNDKAVRFPTFYEVRWAEYVRQLLSATLDNWPFVIKHMKHLNNQEAKGYLRTWTEMGRLKILALCIDLLYLLERLQKRLQSDRTLILDIQSEANVMLKSLSSLKTLQCLK